MRIAEDITSQIRGFIMKGVEGDSFAWLETPPCRSSAGISDPDLVSIKHGETIQSKLDLTFRLNSLLMLNSGKEATRFDGNFIFRSIWTLVGLFTTDHAFTYSK